MHGQWNHHLSVPQRNRFFTIFSASFYHSTAPTVSTLAFLSILQPIVHYSLHFLFPGLIAWYFFRSEWKRAWFLMAATILVDLDHLLATPIFDPNRCSIGFHPLHSYPAIVVYAILMFFPKCRIIALGLLLHMMTDFQDCCWMEYLYALRATS